MKTIKSYTSVWNVERVLYSINDFQLPFPVTFSQMAWFVIVEFAIILLGDFPPLCFVQGAFLKYLGIPIAVTWIMSAKTFDGKKPYNFLKTIIRYLIRPKVTYAGKPVCLKKYTLNIAITAVRSDIYIPD